MYVSILQQRMEDQIHIIIQFEQPKASQGRIRIQWVKREKGIKSRGLYKSFFILFNFSSAIRIEK